LALALDLAPTFTFKPWERDPDPFAPFLLDAERVPFVEMPFFSRLISTDFRIKSARRFEIP
jgi:hypothetical protein